MAEIIELTQLSPTMSEGTFVKWIKNTGEAVEPGEVLAEVETDKAVMEMEAYDEGILLAHLVEKGARIPVGAPVAIIGETGEDISELLEEAKSKLENIQSGSENKEASEKETGRSEKTTDSSEEPRKKQEAADADKKEVQGQEKETTEKSDIKADRTETEETNQEQKDDFSAYTLDRDPSISHPAFLPRQSKKTDVAASPLARKIASEKGIDLSRIEGSGPRGRIVEADLKNLNQSQAFSVTSSRQDKEIELSGMRKVIASRLTEAKNNIPHFYLTVEFNIEPLLTLREQINKDLAAETGDKISLNDFIIKGCALALRQHPVVNSSWRDGKILEHGRIDIGIAVAIDGGLITPYVRNADLLPMIELSQQAAILAEKAKNRKLKPDQYTDGTFTISNLGMFDISEFSAIINEPEAALMAVGGIVSKPVVRNGDIVAGKTMKVTLSCDHRVIDGAEGAKFLQTFCKLIEHPYRLLLG